MNFKCWVRVLAPLLNHCDASVLQGYRMSVFCLFQGIIKTLWQAGGENVVLALQYTLLEIIIADDAGLESDAELQPYHSVRVACHSDMPSKWG